MPDINASLKTTINGKGPQHKMHRVNEFEFTEGSDGALHTKIVDKNGNPIDSIKTELSNLPNDYPDSAVRQELESVKAELQSLKEHTFNTRLSGSIVEDNIIRTKIFGSNVELANGNVVNETIAAGSMLKIFEGKVEATKINGSFRVGENGELAEIRYFPDNAENYIVGEPVEVSNGGERQKNFSFEVFTSHCRLYVRAVENDITLTNFNVIGVLGGKVL